MHPELVGDDRRRIVARRAPDLLHPDDVRVHPSKQLLDAREPRLPRSRVREDVPRDDRAHAYR